VKLKEAKVRLTKEVKQAEAHAISQQARCAALEERMEREREYAERAMAGKQQECDDMLKQLIALQDKMRAPYKKIDKLKMLLSEERRQRANLERELLVHVPPTTFEEAALLSTEVAKLREQHRHALLLIDKYEGLIRVLARKCSLLVGRDGLPDVDAILKEGTHSGERMHDPLMHASDNAVSAAKNWREDADESGGKGTRRTGLLQGHVCWEDAPLSALFGASKALYYAKEDTGAQWLLKSGAQGGFVVDLGTPQVIERFGFKNTRNEGYRDRGTSRYTVYSCGDADALKQGRWQVMHVHVCMYVRLYVVCLSTRMKYSHTYKYMYEYIHASADGARACVWATPTTRRKYTYAFTYTSRTDTYTYAHVHTHAGACRRRACVCLECSHDPYRLQRHQTRSRTLHQIRGQQLVRQRGRTGMVPGSLHACNAFQVVCIRVIPSR
jgi:hypothetical protein